MTTDWVNQYGPVLGIIQSQERVMQGEQLPDLEKDIGDGWFASLLGEQIFMNRFLLTKHIQLS
jgi:hypothetical protein